MKIDQVTLDYLKRAIKCATIGKIDNLSIEPGKVRGMDDGQVVFIFHTDRVPTFSFGSIGFNRMSTFTTRMDLMSGAANVDITAVTDTNKNGDMFVRSLDMAGKGVKVNYRCANPAVIRAPKVLTDDVRYELTLTDEAINFMSKGSVAMSSDEITITAGPDGTFFEITDINGDVFSYTFPSNATDITSAKDAEFSHTFPLKTLLPLLKAAGSDTVHLTDKNGMMKMVVEGFDVYVFPRS